jgi:hypothetical protein
MDTRDGKLLTEINSELTKYAHGAMKLYEVLMLSLLDPRLIGMNDSKRNRTRFECIRDRSKKTALL